MKASRIGVDFDGTVIVYDEVFREEAIAGFGLPADIPADKHAIRRWFWRTEAGRADWVRLQGAVYGAGMARARLAEGVRRFLEQCRRQRLPVFVISHKTEYPAAGPRVDLREASRRWIEAQGLFDQGFLQRAYVFFEGTRAEKIARIAACSCTHFVDDLPEVFEEPGFPAGVVKMLYAPRASVAPPAGALEFRSWDEVSGYFRGMA